MSAGHLIQAAVALSRGTGREDVLDLARRFADVAGERFGGEACEPGLNGLGTDLHHERCNAQRLAEIGREVAARLDLASDGVVAGPEFGGWPAVRPTRSPHAGARARNRARHAA
jgi:hypothetical protein